MEQKLLEMGQQLVDMGLRLIRTDHTALDFFFEDLYLEHDRKRRDERDRWKRNMTRHSDFIRRKNLLGSDSLSFDIEKLHNESRKDTLKHIENDADPKRLQVLRDLIKSEDERLTIEEDRMKNVKKNLEEEDQKTGIGSDVFNLEKGMWMCSC
jgi:hypothetical protein